MNAVHLVIRWAGLRVGLGSVIVAAALLPGLAVATGHPRVRGALLVIAVPDVLVLKHDRTAVVAAPGVLGNDIGVGGGTTALLVSGPSHGVLTLDANGGYGYVPDAGYVGTDSFRYRPSGVIATPATVAITITNAAPVAGADVYAATAGSPRVVPAPGVLANDIDADGDQLSASLVTGVSHGLLSLAASGAFTYTATGGYSGTDTFTYRAWDGVAWSGPATVGLAVTAAAPSPMPSAAPTPTPILPLPSLPVPTPSLGLPIPTQPIPTLPAPSVLPTPTPTPGSTSGTASSPSTRPVAASLEAQGPSPASVGLPTGQATGSGPEILPGGAPQGGVVVRSRVVTPADLGVGAFTGLDGLELWIVPSAVIGVPGLLVILWVAIQVATGLAWLPAARRLRGPARRRSQAT